MLDESHDVTIRYLRAKGSDQRQGEPYKSLCHHRHEEPDRVSDMRPISLEQTDSEGARHTYQHGKQHAGNTDYSIPGAGGVSGKTHTRWDDLDKVELESGHLPCNQMSELMCGRGQKDAKQDQNNDQANMHGSCLLVSQQ